MIRTITEKARAMMIDSQVPIQFWGEAVNTAVYLHQRSPNEGLKRKNDNDGYQAPYETPYEMLHGFGNQRTMLTATKYRIKPLSTTYVDSDATPVHSFPKFNASRASSAQGQSPA
jgi:hypothetical protein